MTWREYEAMLVEFFSSEGVDVLSSDGDKCIEVSEYGTRVSVSLTRLAHMLEDR